MTWPVRKEKSFAHERSPSAQGTGQDRLPPAYLKLSAEERIQALEQLDDLIDYIESQGLYDDTPEN